MKFFFISNMCIKKVKSCHVDTSITIPKYRAAPALALSKCRGNLATPTMIRDLFALFPHFKLGMLLLYV